MKKTLVLEVNLELVDNEEDLTRLLQDFAAAFSANVSWKALENVPGEHVVSEARYANDRAATVFRARVVDGTPSTTAEIMSEEDRVQ